MDDEGDLCWDLTCLWFASLTSHHVRGQSLDDLKARCAADDAGQGIIVATVMVAAAAGL